MLLVGDWAQLSPVHRRRGVQAPGRRPTRPRHPDRRAPVPPRMGTPRLPGAARRRRDRRRGVPATTTGSSPATATTCWTCCSTQWSADTRDGLSSLMIAPDAATVDDLNTRARAARVAAGEVHADGVELRRRDHHRGRRHRRHPPQPPRPGHHPRVGEERRHLDRRHHPARRVRPGPLPVWVAPRRPCRRTTSPTTSSSATPPPPTVPKAAPSTPPTPTSPPPRPGRSCT